MTVRAPEPIVLRDYAKVPCTTCNAAVGEPCRSDLGRPQATWHAARARRWERETYAPPQE